MDSNYPLLKTIFAPNKISSMSETYIGDELELFSHAKNWKNYWGSKVKPYLGKRVLEVGAGLGGTTQYLYNTNIDSIEQWTCLEPDATLAKAIEQKIVEKKIPPCDVIISTLDNFKNKSIGDKILYNSILYIDVIEHIKNDAAELSHTLDYLETGGHLIILVPAHQYLYSPFDKSIGHYRRYSRSMLEKIVPKGYDIVQSQYLDALGLGTSLANKWFLKQDYPTLPQILFWDKYVVTTSTIVDKLLFHNVGKSVLLIAQKKE
jgi:2-polyprenyl-3-methyl-5-hydroxy-6-metoxy-1,4-benzoquinol methylase